jgi:hypothetical protein
VGPHFRNRLLTGGDTNVGDHRVVVRMVRLMVARDDLEATLSLAGPTIGKALRELSRRDLIHQHAGRDRRTTDTPHRHTDQLHSCRHTMAPGSSPQRGPVVHLTSQNANRRVRVASLSLRVRGPDR